MKTKTEIIQFLEDEKVCFGEYASVSSASDRNGSETLLVDLLDRFQNLDSKPLLMKFKDAPVGTRFKFTDTGLRKDIWVKVNDYGSGLVVQWKGNVGERQSHCCWVDEDNGYSFDTLIEVL